MSRTRSRSSGLAAKVVLALAVVALIGKYTDAHQASHHLPILPAHTASAPIAAGSVQAQEHAVFGSDYACADQIIDHEDASRDPHATNPGSGAYGVPQALPGSKMAAAGPDWRDNSATQLSWMKTYVDTRYGGACPAWTWWQAHHWY
jgi:hypothetical protein